MFKKILLPVDQPEYDENVLNMAKDIATKYKSELIIFNSQDVTPNIYWVNDPSVLNSINLNTKNYAKDVVNQVSEFFKDTNIKITLKTAMGDPAAEILHLIEYDPSIDLIIMSTHGMSTIKRFLLGSVTNKIIHHASIPVLVVR